MPDTDFPRARRTRLLEALAAEADTFVFTRPEHVYYFTGLRPVWRQMPALVIAADGRTTLVWPNQPAETAAVDRSVSYVANFSGTLRQDQAPVVAEAVGKVLDEHGGRSFACDSSETSTWLMTRHKPKIIDRALYQLRRRKDEAELDLMRVAIEATRAMYATARAMIAPGVEELDVFNALHAAAIRSTGEPMTALLGNDYACAAGGGPARAARPAAAGELYVLDLGPTYRGYFADNCRTFAVDRRPTDAQFKAHAAVADVFPIVERLAKPGVSCRELSRAVDEHLKSRLGVGLVHHLGHGVGLAAHELPHVNLQSDHVLEQGDVFTAEPGVYGPHLAGGLRLENQYLVTATGVENLSPFDLSMT